MNETKFTELSFFQKHNDYSMQSIFTNETQRTTTKKKKISNPLKKYCFELIAQSNILKANFHFIFSTVAKS